MKRSLLLALLLVSPVFADPALEGRVRGIVAQMTVAEKFRMLGGHDDFWSYGVARLGVPDLKMSDGPMGVHDYGLVTAYPAPIALAASWNVELARRVGDSLGQDARALGVGVLLAPGMNLYRAPMNGRNFEYLGEDPFLAGRLAVGLIQGIQGRGVMATAKHFIANNSEYGRMDHSSDLDERTMRELYLPAFEMCVKEGHVAAVMDAYNLVNGVYATEHAALNVDILQKEWLFDGILMSDWGATHDGLAAARGGLDLEMPSAQFMSPAVLQAGLNSGKLDMATIDDKVTRIVRKTLEFPAPPQALPLYSQLGRQVALEAARDGMVLLKNHGGLLPLQRARHRRVVVLGPDAHPAVPSGGGSAQTESFVKVSLLEGISNVAGASVQVLSPRETVDVDRVVEGSRFRTAAGAPGLDAEYWSNESLSGEPALKRVESISALRFGEGSYAATGPADHFSARWTGTFTPEQDDDYRFYTSADDGVRLWVNDQPVVENWKPQSDTLSSGVVRLEAGKPARIRLEYFENVGGASLRFGVAGGQNALSEWTREQVRTADAVVICAGFSPSSESEGLDRSFGLPPGQDALIREVAELNPRTVVAVTAGGNVDMEPWIDRVAAVHCWYPGQEGGTAFGQLLWGDRTPSGKLPASFERRWKDNPTHDHYYPAVEGSKKVSYDEGLFLGYRGYDQSKIKPRFPFGFGLSYTRFEYSGLKATATGATFRIRNVGKRRGAEVAQLYVSDGHSALPRPVKELKGFARVELAPGESREVRVPLNLRSFSYWDPARHGWRMDPGQFTLLVGSSSADIRLRSVVEVAAGSPQGSP